MSSIQSAQLGQDHGPLPLVIGVTGHRDLQPEDTPVLAQTVRQALEQIQAERSHTPLVLLSSLAEGADRLVARLALQLGARLIVPLPMPPAEYEKDFKNPESRAEFRTLLEQAEWQFVVPAEQAAEAIAPVGQARQQRYMLAGAFIARNCQILLALWDGEKPVNEGGTSQVVTFVRAGVPPAIIALLERGDGASGEEAVEEFEERGLVYHIPTPHLSNRTPSCGGPVQLKRIYPESILERGAVEERFERILFHIDRFNRDRTRLAHRIAARANDPKNWLLPREQPENLPAELALIESLYLTTDGLALEFQDRTRFARRGLFILVFLAVLAFGLYAHLDALQTLWTVILYLLVLVLAYMFWFSFAGPSENKKHAPWIERVLAVFFRKLERGDFHDKYLDYRAVSEGLRVQFYWRLAGLYDRVEDHYLSKHRSELDWIRTAIRNWRLLVCAQTARLPASSAGEPADAEPVKTVHDQWVAGQRDFFIRAVKRDEARLVRDEHFIRAFLLAGIALIIVSAFVEHRLEAWGHGLLLVFAALAPVTAALIHTYAEQQALPEHIKQYERMSMLFASAWSRIDASIRAGDLALARQRLRTLGKEALAENGDWVLLHRERPLDVPKAG
jgi:hypothetical protein